MTVPAATRPTVRNWTEAFPDRLQFELAEFARLGLDFVLDEVERARSGRVVLRGSLPARLAPGGEDVELVVAYPDSFPYLRPEVFAPQLRLGRHQNPHRGNLCLLDRSSRAWSPSTTAAWLVSFQVPYLLRLLAGDPATMMAEEAPQGEPASRYFTAAAGSAVFVPEEMLELDQQVRAGYLRIALGRGTESRQQLLRGCLTRVESLPGKRGARTELARATGPVAQRFDVTAYEGTWVRLDSLPSDGRCDAGALFKTARAVPGFVMPPAQQVDGGALRILGVVTREEVRQGVFEDVWLFAVAVEVHKPKRGRGSYVAHTERLSAGDLSARIPSLVGLGDKTVSLSGLGALGGPLAFELARAQLGELRVLDDDIVETGTVVRWPLGLTAVGHVKPQVLMSVLPVQWPMTEVVPFAHRIGAVASPLDEAEREASAERDVLTAFLADADLLLDATAEIGVQQLLSSLASEAGLPQVYVWSTEGGIGGAVARVVPGETGCWHCLQLHIEEGTIPPPPLADGGRVQPRGCAEPTWTGSSFDALPLVAHAMRVVTTTLLTGRRAAGGREPHDVFVLEQESPGGGELTAPVWRSYSLTEHPRCPLCRAT
jgi:hypothetical protein